MNAAETFYAQLPGFERFAEVCDLAHYHAAPPDWSVVITDVEGSTRAIEEGRYKDVNALGVASIVALSNALPGVQFPYVFGGDGASFLVPNAKLDAVRAALQGLRRTSADAFDLSMRVGVVPVSDLPEDSPLLVARFQASPHVSLAMFAGRGLAEAERLVKDPEQGVAYAVPDGAGEADFTGFECRWQPIEARSGLMVSMLVQATSRDAEEQADAYRRVLEFLDELTSAEEARPVDPSTLVLASLGAPYSQEARLRAGSAAGMGVAWRRLVAGLSTTIGKTLFATGLSAGGFNGKAYRDEVTANTDFRKFDDTLRMVVDLGEARAAKLAEFLEGERAAGRVAYGLHRSRAALMTCAISSYAGDHVHFIDGSDGGYALAAKELKAQLKAQPPAE